MINDHVFGLGFRPALIGYHRAVVHGGAPDVRPARSRDTFNGEMRPTTTVACRFAMSNAPARNERRQLKNKSTGQLADSEEKDS